MSLNDVERPFSGAMPDAAIHRRWVLSKRADDGRPLLVREDRIVHPKDFGTRSRGAAPAGAREAAIPPGLRGGVVPARVGGPAHSLLEPRPRSPRRTGEPASSR